LQHPLAALGQIVRDARHLQRQTVIVDDINVSAHVRRDLASVTQAAKFRIFQAEFADYMF
jgi:hypothetical protein